MLSSSVLLTKLKKKKNPERDYYYLIVETTECKAVHPEDAVVLDAAFPACWLTVTMRNHEEKHVLCLRWRD